jgi:hypothetical protein
VTAGIGVVFEEDDDLCVVDFVGGRTPYSSSDLKMTIGVMRVRARFQACFWARERSCCI